MNVHDKINYRSRLPSSFPNRMKHSYSACFCLVYCDGLLMAHVFQSQVRNRKKYKRILFASKF